MDAVPRRLHRFSLVSVRVLAQNPAPLLGEGTRPMQCKRCGHHNVTSLLFCESCLAPLGTTGDVQRDVVGHFFDDADLLESSGSTEMSRGAAVPQRVVLPWRGEADKIALTGRDEETQRLVGAVRAALDARGLQAMLVQGEAGSGRSRLLDALRLQIGEQRPGTRVLMTSAQGMHRPYAMIERLLRLRFDIPDYLGGTIAGERFERTVESFYGDPAGADVARTCGPMLGFHFWNEHSIDFDDRAEQQRRAREALDSLIRKDLTHTATVIAIDDAGDADEQSLAFLQHLVVDGADLPAVIVLSSDRRGVNRRPWLGDLEKLELQPLKPAALDAIARRALNGVLGVDDSVLKVLAQHANGRPGTLLDELESLALHGAIVRDADNWRVLPARIRELAASGGLRSSRGGRLDGLDDFQLKVASLGAVFGQRFWLGGVVALLRGERAASDAKNVADLGRDETPERVRRACAGLVEKGQIVPERGAILPHETCFRFVAESDLESLLEQHDLQALQALSHRAAVWLQMVAGERAFELSDVLAPLWLRAGERTHAGHVCLRAGERALDEFRHDQAGVWLRQARELIPAEDAHVHTAVLLGLGRLAEFDGRAAEAEQHYRDALGLAWRFRARSKGAAALQRIGRLLRSQGKVQAAVDHFMAAYKLHEAVGNLGGMGATCDDLGRTWWIAGHMDPARQWLDRAAQLRGRLGDRAGQAHTLANLGLVSLSLGNLEQAAEWLEKAAEIHKENKNLVGLFEALNATCGVQVAGGQHDAAVSTMEEVHELARRIGNRRMIAMAQNNLGEVLLLASRIDEGEALLYKAVEGAGRLGDNAVLSDAARNLAQAARRRNDQDRALKWARRAVAAAQQLGMVRTRAASLRTLAEVHADVPDADAAHDAFLKSSQVLESAGEVCELVACLQAHAAFLTRVGRSAEAHALMEKCDRVTAIPSLAPRRTATPAATRKSGGTPKP
ncbi:MAG: tetratricopeptide repeat protein [Myxococcales bacterium]|nr:tetratricopeptide repeat protein [Myxococcales bacterium]